MSISPYTWLRVLNYFVPKSNLNEKTSLHQFRFCYGNFSTGSGNMLFVTGVTEMPGYLSVNNTNNKTVFITCFYKHVSLFQIFYKQ